MADISKWEILIMNDAVVNIHLWPCRDKFRLITHPKGFKCKLTVEDTYLNLCEIQGIIQAWRLQMENISFR